jgi:diacylglycerol kinase (ATP)
MNFIKKVKYALDGISITLVTQSSFRFEVTLSIIAVLLCFVIQVTTHDVILIILACLIALGAELFNTAIEKICDFVHADHNEEIGVIKDISAGAVLLTFVGCYGTVAVLLMIRLYELMY